MKWLHHHTRAWTADPFAHMDHARQRDFLLMSARREFPEFYGEASPADADRLDALVLIHVALLIGMYTSRNGLAGAARTYLELQCDGTERVFMHLRERVRGCPTFIHLGFAERARIENTLFKPRPPG
jgi:hypothetical protein